MTCYGIAQVPAVTRPVPQSIRVASWNIDHGSELDKITSALKSNPADLYLFQEVDQNALRSGQKDVAVELGQRLGMHFPYAAKFKDLSKEKGGKPFIEKATLTSLPILK